MRAGRLVAILLRIQERGSVTAAQLAQELEVSVRTIYRDVSALQAAGAPLWTQSGPQGGIHLLEGWRTDLDGLTDGEAAALFVGGPPAVVEQLGLGSVLAAAQVKMLATLPPEAARRAADARSRFLLDAPGWFARPEATPALPEVAEAVWTNRRLAMTYRRADGVVERSVDPLGLVLKAGIWYLVAGHGEDLRTYRVSRMTTATVTAEPFERADGFDLATAWSQLSADFDRSILTTTVRLRVGPHGLRRLPQVVPTAATVDAVAEAGPPDPDGWREVVLPVESEAVALAQLVSLGAAVEVLEPTGVRRALAGIGREMAERNGAPPN